MEVDDHDSVQRIDAGDGFVIDWHFTPEQIALHAQHGRTHIGHIIDWLDETQPAANGPLAFGTPPPIEVESVEEA